MHVRHFGDPRLNIAPLHFPPKPVDAPNEASSVKESLPGAAQAPKGRSVRVVSGPHAPFPPAPCYPPGAGSLPGGQPGWTRCWPAWVGTAFPGKRPPKAGETQGRDRRPPQPPQPQCGISEISLPVTIRRQVFLFLNPSPVAILVCVSRLGFVVGFFFQGLKCYFFPLGEAQ